MPQKTTISVEDFKKRLDEGRIEFLFDLRNEDEFKDWRVEGRTDVPTINIPQPDFVGEEDRHLGRFPRDKEIITVCAHGDSSKYSAELLQGKGFRALGLEGGMDRWSEFYETRKVHSDPDIYQIYRVARGCISHVIVSEGSAVVIDPVRHIDNITALVDRLGAKVTAVLDTHLQADHISGGRDLCERTGAEYHISPADAAGCTYEHVHVRDGLELGAGKHAIRCMFTPGHTSGIHTFVLDNTFFFTGDTIMKTSIGRPDLAGKVDEWAGFLFETLHKRFAPVSDEVIILPSHAASIREQDEYGIVRLTLGYSRKDSRLFNIKELAPFIAHVKATLPENPARYQDIRKVNLGTLVPDEKKAKELEIGKNLCGMTEAHNGA